MEDLFLSKAIKISCKNAEIICEGNYYFSICGVFVTHLRFCRSINILIKHCFPKIHLTSLTLSLPLPLLFLVSMEALKAGNLYILCPVGAYYTDWSCGSVVRSTCCFGENLSSIPSTHIAIHKLPYLQLPVPSSNLHGHQTQTWCMYIYAAETLKHTIICEDRVKYQTKT